MASDRVALFLEEVDLEIWAMIKRGLPSQRCQRAS
jgi:hypothetical protein